MSPIRHLGEKTPLGPETPMSPQRDNIYNIFKFDELRNEAYSAPPSLSRDSPLKNYTKTHNRDIRVMLTREKENEARQRMRKKKRDEAFMRPRDDENETDIENEMMRYVEKDSLPPIRERQRVVRNKTDLDFNARPTMRPAQVSIKKYFLKK